MTCSTLKEISQALPSCVAVKDEKAYLARPSEYSKALVTEF